MNGSAGGGTLPRGTHVIDQRDEDEGEAGGDWASVSSSGAIGDDDGSGDVSGAAGNDIGADGGGGGDDIVDGGDDAIGVCGVCDDGGDGDSDSGGSAQCMSWDILLSE